MALGVIQTPHVAFAVRCYAACEGRHDEEKHNALSVLEALWLKGGVPFSTKK